MWKGIARRLSPDGVWRRLVATLRRDFLAGLLVFVPVGFTILGVLWIINQLDQLVLPRIFRAIGMEAHQPPVVGTVATLCVILLAGALTRSFIGRGLIAIWERFIDNVPIARSLYSVVKQFMQAVVGSGQASSFDRVVLVEYPRRGLYTYAFVTGERGPVSPGMPSHLVKIFVPSTPNPTTGYYLLVPKEDLIETTLTPEEAFKLIVSAGIVDDPRAGNGAGPARPPRDPHP